MIAIVLLLVVGVGALVAALTSGDSGGGAATPASSSTTTAPIDPDGRTLVALLDKGRALTTHVTYAPAVGGQVGSTAVELWRDGGKVRQDVDLREGDVENHIESFVLPGDDALCQRRASEAWTCVAMGTTSTGEAVGIADSALGNLAGRDVSVEDERILDVTARCFTIRADDGARSQLCVTAEGIPVRITFGDQALDATSIERTVDPSVFTPPAPLTPLNTPPTSAL